jgi:hypothetical protein
MRPALRLISWAVALLFASASGTLPGCASMGGGMKYVLDPQPASEVVTVL